MRRHPTTGQIAHGIAGDGVYVDGTQIAAGGGQNGMPDWLDGAPIWCGQTGKPFAFIRGSQVGAWAGWTSLGGVTTSWGLTLPLAVLLDMAPDGTLLVGDNYQSGVGISAYRVGSLTELWRVAAARPELRFPYSQACILDAQTACWTENQNGRMVLVGFGLTAWPRPPWNVLHARLFRVNGEVWVVYLRAEDDRTIAHPWDYRGLGFSVPSFGYGPEAFQDGAFLTLCWSIGAGERAGDIKDKTFNLAALEAIPSLPVARPIGPMSDPLPEGTWIDVAEFFKLDEGCWPRGDKARGDTHGMDMQAVMHEGESCIWFAKFDKDGQGGQGELLSVDSGTDGYIHWRADCSNAKDVLNPDGTVKKEAWVDLPSDTRWLRKRMQIGRRYGLDVGDHTLRIVRRKDGSLIEARGFNREMWIIAVWERFWCGADFGECRVLRYGYNNTGYREGGTGHPELYVETYYMAITADGRIVGWGDWTYDQSSVVFDSGSAEFPDPPDIHSDFWHLGGQRFPPDLPSFPMPISIPSETPMPETFPMPAAEFASIKQFDGVFPLPQGGDEVVMHDWSRRAAEYVKFRHDAPGIEYGLKSTSPGSPTSNNLARRDAQGIHTWDYIAGSASATPSLKPDGGEYFHIPNQHFIPVTAVNHLNIAAPTNRPPIKTPLWGVTAFDLGARVASGDWRFYEQVVKANKLVPRVNVYATIDHPQTGRLYRDFDLGMTQMKVLLPRMVQDGMAGQFILLVGTGPDADNISRQQALDRVRLMNALFQQFPAAVRGLQIGNEVVYEGLEASWLSEVSFCQEVEAIIDPRFPLTWGAGHGGGGVNMQGGSYLVHHEDRDKTPDQNGPEMKAAQDLAKRKVISDEPRRIEKGGTGQATGDPTWAPQQIAAVKKYDLGGSTLHIAAGRGCDIGFMDDIQWAAAAAYGAEAKGVVVTPPGPITPPGTGHPLLDADMGELPKFYHTFINNRSELEALAVAWYTKSHGHPPADPDIAHGFYWRAMREWSWFGTLRRAFEDTWPGGAPD